MSPRVVLRLTTFLATVTLLLATSGCTEIEKALADSEGEKLWIEHCARCHGRYATGNTPRYMGHPWTDLTDDHWRHGGDDVAIETVIYDGVFGEMPAFNEELSGKQVKAVVRYLRELRGERKPRGS